jgi:hypothetical protein
MIHSNPNHYNNPFSTMNNMNNMNSFPYSNQQMYMAGPGPYHMMNQSGPSLMQQQAMQQSLQQSLQHPVGPMQQPMQNPMQQQQPMQQQPMQQQPMQQPMQQLMGQHMRQPMQTLKKRTAAEMEDKITLGGKWTAEEEAYSAVLIQHFRTGALQDCEDSTSLRSYLAEKLQCIPMRISKKFAGVKIGKEIFRRGPTSKEVAMQLSYIRDLFIQSTSKKRKRIKKKMQKAAIAKKEVAESSTTDVETSPPNDDAATSLATPTELYSGDKPTDSST